MHKKKAALEVQNLNGINFTVYLIREKKFEKPICLWPQTMYLKKWHRNAAKRSPIHAYDIID